MSIMIIAWIGLTPLEDVLASLITTTPPPYKSLEEQVTSLCTALTMGTIIYLFFITYLSNFFGTNADGHMDYPNSTFTHYSASGQRLAGPIVNTVAPYEYPKTLRVAFLSPMLGGAGYINTAAAARMAVEDAQRNGILPGVNVK